MKDITERLDKIASEIEKENPFIALAIDRVSDKLERRGETSEKSTSEIDPSELTKQDYKKMKIEVTIKSSSVDREIIATLVEAGLIEDFKKLFSKGKRFWQSMWDSIDDKATKAAIKALNTKEKVKAYIKKNPKLKWVVLGAIALGFLVLPPAANAELLDAPGIKELASGIDIDFYAKAGEIVTKVDVSPEWIEELAKHSLAETGSPEEAYKHLQENLIKVFQEKSVENRVPKQFASDWIEMAQRVGDRIYKVINQKGLLFKKAKYVYSGVKEDLERIAKQYNRMIITDKEAYAKAFDICSRAMPDKHVKLNDIAEREQVGKISHKEAYKEVLALVEK